MRPKPSSVEAIGIFLSTPWMQESFWKRVDKTDGCWNWTGIKREKFPYGRYAVHGRQVMAHRLSYALHNGAVPADLFVCHRCDNPVCVNPAHLFLGTTQDNTRDMDRKGRRGSTRGRSFWRGSTTPGAKLTEAQVIAIRGLADQPRKAVAARFGVAPNTVSQIIHRRIWSHV